MADCLYTSNMLFGLVFLFFSQHPNETDPAKIVLGAGLNIYQKVVSRSQGDVCNFSPSCSNFAKQAMSKYGPVWGMLMATDRLMRCNPTAVNHYGKYYTGIKDQKLYDPVEKNYIWKDYVETEDDTLKDVEPKPFKDEP